MLCELEIAGFKCFEKITLPLSKMTLLSGVNGCGKSSVMQALVLLAQTLVVREWGRSLLLDGPEISLGCAGDVLNQRGAESLTLGAATSNERVLWTFKSNDRRSLSLDLKSVSRNGCVLPLADDVRWLLPWQSAISTADVISLLRRLSWISAERTGPREVLPLKDAFGNSRVGPHGDLAAGILYQRESDGVSELLCLDDVPPTLFHQVRARMRELFPGYDMRVSPIEGANAVNLLFRSNTSADFQRPQNVGFGLTQVFPIVVALLAARIGDVLLIENPEVHLHPRAQQEIGTLIARVAASGVQCIVETHSDHVLNGIRLAVGKGIAAPEDVAIHFFSRNTSDGTVQALSPRIDRSGRLDAWPEGFFDQFDLALSQLL